MGTILEKYRGHQIVIERKTTNGVVEGIWNFGGLFVKVSFGRDVQIREEHLLNFLKDWVPRNGKT